MFNTIVGPHPPKGYKIKPGECPVAKASPGRLVSCHCIGTCRDRLVPVDSDQDTDTQ